MDKSMSSAAEEVVKIIKESLETIANHREVERRDGGEPKGDLFFPDGIGDIQVTVKAPGVVEIDVTLASSPPKGDRFVRTERIPIRATSHPMYVHYQGDKPIYVAFSETKGGKYGNEEMLSPGDLTLIWDKV